MSRLAATREGGGSLKGCSRAEPRDPVPFASYRDAERERGALEGRSGGTGLERAPERARNGLGTVVLDYFWSRSLKYS